MRRRIMTRSAGARRLGGAVLALLVAGCGILDPDGGRRGELEDAMERWQALGMADYELEVARRCYCGPDALGPVKVRVERGNVTRRTYVSTGEDVRSEAAPWFPDVDGLFGIIADALDRGAYRLDVTYDDGTGVPVDIWIDYLENVADEELGFGVSLPVALGG